VDFFEVIGQGLRLEEGQTHNLVTKILGGGVEFTSFGHRKVLPEIGQTA
jgi:hypothetical protein